MIAGTPSGKAEFSPLLPLGRHEMTLAHLRQVCVDRFPLSATRPVIMGGLEKVINKLLEDAVKGEVWVDGSFVTEKMDPAMSTWYADAQATSMRRPNRSGRMRLTGCCRT